MAKKPPVPASDDDEAPIYVGAWIRAHGYKPAEVARGAPINEGYLSGIISGKKKNPTRAMLKRIATFLEIGVGDLYRPPPTAAVLDQVAKYDPGVVLRLSEKRKKSG